LPFPLVAVDTDNGGEFLNKELLSYCAREQITFTRGRTGKKKHPRCGYPMLRGTKEWLDCPAVSGVRPLRR